jgi:hypothetical protein
MLKRVVVGLIVIAAVATSAWVSWRWQVQTVDVVIVNASGGEVDVTWQSWPLAEQALVSVGACESRTLRLHAGATWRLHADGLEVSSAAFEIPLQERAAALEIWLEPDGSSRLVLPYPVTGTVVAPAPNGCGSEPN